MLGGKSMNFFVPKIKKAGCIDPAKRSRSDGYDNRILFFAEVMVKKFRSFTNVILCASKKSASPRITFAASLSMNPASISVVPTPPTFTFTFANGVRFIAFVPATPYTPMEGFSFRSIPRSSANWIFTIEYSAPESMSASARRSPPGPIRATSRRGIDLHLPLTSCGRIGL